MLSPSARLPFDHLVCDLDGTLVDSAPGILASVRHSVAAHFPEAAPRVGPALIGPPIQEMFRNLLGPLEPERLDELIARFRAHYDECGILASRAFEGVHATLDALRAAGIECYVLTQKPTAVTRRMLEHHDLARFVRDTLSPDDPADPFQSKAAGLRSLARRHALPPGRTAMVGDSEDDLAAAEACGLAFHAAGYGYGGARPRHGRALARFDEILRVRVD